MRHTAITKPAVKNEELVVRNQFVNVSRALLLNLALFIGFSVTAQAQISGAGSTVVQPLLAAWATKFGATVPSLRFDGNGSQAGVKALQAGTVDFAGTEVPFTQPELERGGLAQVVLSADALAVVVNLPGVARVQISGLQLVDIFQGRTTNWAQVAQAGGSALPSLPIVRHVRADGSGSTYVFSTYLSRSDKAWARGHASGMTVDWPAGAKGVESTAAMLEAVKKTPGAIGYAALGAAVRSGASLALISNASGAYIKPSLQGVQAALAAATWNDQTGVVDVDGVTGRDSWPMTVVSYILFKKAAPSTKNLQVFFGKALNVGDAEISALSYAPMPPAGKTRAKAQLGA